MSNTTDTTVTLDTDNATVKAVVTQIKAELKGDSRYGAYVAEFSVTRANVKDHAYALARLITPQTPITKDNVRTKFGNAVQTAQKGLTRALPDAEQTDTDWLKLVRQATENAHNKGEFSVDRIMHEVRSVLSGEVSESDAA